MNIPLTVCFSWRNLLDCEMKPNPKTVRPPCDLAKVLAPSSGTHPCCPQYNTTSQRGLEKAQVKCLVSKHIGLPHTNLLPGDIPHISLARQTTYIVDSCLMLNTGEKNIYIYQLSLSHAFFTHLFVNHPQLHLVELVLGDASHACAECFQGHLVHDAAIVEKFVPVMQGGKGSEAGRILRVKKWHQLRR